MFTGALPRCVYSDGRARIGVSARSHIATARRRSVLAFLTPVLAPEGVAKGVAPPLRLLLPRTEIGDAPVTAATRRYDPGVFNKCVMRGIGVGGPALGTVAEVGAFVFDIGGRRKGLSASIPFGAVWPLFRFSVTELRNVGLKDRGPLVLRFPSASNNSCLKVLLSLSLAMPLVGRAAGPLGGASCDAAVRRRGLRERPTRGRSSRRVVG